MVKIKYRIIDDISHISTLTAKEFDDEYSDLEGDFALYFGEYDYGHFDDAPIREGQWGWEILFHQFYGMLNVCIELKNSGYILKDSIETINYIEFKLNDDNVFVSELITDKLEDPWMQCTSKYISQFYYDGMNKMRYSSDKQNKLTRYSYDGLGRRIFKESETILAMTDITPK